MKRYILLLFCAILPFCAVAQNNRIIKGAVISEDDNRLSGVEIMIDGNASQILTDENGNFTISVPATARKLSVVVDGFLPHEVEIDGTMVVFRLKYDRNTTQYMEKYEKERRERGKQYDNVFKNKGLVHSIDVSYGYQISKGELIYQNSGYTKYGDLSPLSLTYSIGWRFNSFISLSAGVGVTLNLRSLEKSGDKFGSYYKDWSPRRVDVPIFLNTKMYLSKTKVQPLVSLSCGVYACSKTLLLDLGLGVSVRVTKATAVNVMAVIGSTPWVNIDDDGISYKNSFTPGVRIGYSF